MLKVECDFCAGAFDGASLDDLECGHRVCHDCLRRSYEDYPARCCEFLALTAQRAKVLGVDLVEKYIQKRREYEASIILYCSRPECSTFLPSESIFRVDALAICPDCNHFTCMKCRQTHHGDTPCPVDHDIQETQELAEKEGWKACYGCGHIIEKTMGCNHMQCPCGNEFCYQCGTPWKECDCPHFDGPPDQEAQLAEDEIAMGFMAMMHGTTEYVIDGDDVPTMLRYLERLQVGQQDAEHPDWFQLFIDDVEAALAQREEEDLIWF